MSERDHDHEHVQTELSDEQHKARHVMLHRALDELVADFFWQSGRLPSRTTLMEFMQWSGEQTRAPTKRGG